MEWARSQRQKAAPSNPLLAFERLWAESVIQGLDLFRDLRDAAYENTFLSIYGSPALRAMAQAPVAETADQPHTLRRSPQVQKALGSIERGDLAAGVIRMLVLLAGSRGSVRRDRLERSAQVLNGTDPFKAMGPERRGELIQEQSIIGEFEPKLAVETLPVLLRTAADRSRAMELVNFIVGAREEMEPHSLKLIQRMEQILGLAENKSESPVVTSKAVARKSTRKAKKA